MKVEILTVLFLCAITGISDGSRILIYYPTIGHSHVIPLQGLAKTLAGRNHEITFVSPFPLKEQIPNYRDIKLQYDDTDAAAFVSQVTKEPQSVSFLHMIKMMPQLLFHFGNETLQSSEVRQLMKEEKFDLLITGFFFTDFGLGLADHFKCPSIVFGSGSFWTLNKMVGNPMSVSAVPHMMLGGQMTSFINRVKNVFANFFEMLMSEYMKYQCKQIYEYGSDRRLLRFGFLFRFIFSFNFPSSQGYISYEEAHNNVSLVLLNTHFSSGQVRPILPNLVEVGGLQVKQKNSKLPEVKLQYKRHI